MSKYRIVQFNNGKYALQRVFHLFWCIPIPLNSFRERNDSYHWSDSSSILSWCVFNTLEAAKDRLEELTPAKLAPLKIAEVIKDSKLEKVLK